MVNFAKTRTMVRKMYYVYAVRMVWSSPCFTKPRKSLLLDPDLGPSSPSRTYTLNQYTTLLAAQKARILSQGHHRGLVHFNSLLRLSPFKLLISLCFSLKQAVWKLSKNYPPHQKPKTSISVTLTKINCNH